jgi:type II secretory pathway component PulK
LSIFAVGLGNRISQEINLSAFFSDKPKSLYLSEAAVKICQNMLSSDKNEFDSLNEFWNTGRLSDDGRFLFKDVQLGQGSYSVRIVDEERKININSASHQVLERLFRITGGIDADLAHIAANSVIDWRDADANPLEGGAEDGYYKSLEDPYRPKNGRFEVLEELLLVRGVTDEMFSRIKDAVTIYGDGRVNINTATRDSLLALGMSEEFVYKLIAYRKGPDGLEGTKDDNVFKNPATIAKELVFGAGLNIEESDRIFEMTTKNMLSVSSLDFTIDAEGRIGRRTEKITCVTDRGKNIEYWRE